MTSESAAAKELRGGGLVAWSDALLIVMRGMDAYKAKHPKWWKRMDGTPILNDLPVVIAEVIAQELHYPPQAERTQPSSAVEHSSHNRLAPTRERMGSQANGATDGGTGGATPSNATNAGSIPAGPASPGEPEKAREEVAAIVRDDGVRWLIPLNLPIGTKFYRKVQP